MNKKNNNTMTSDVVARENKDVSEMQPAEKKDTVHR